MIHQKNKNVKSKFFAKKVYACSKCYGARLEKNGEIECCSNCYCLFESPIIFDSQLEYRVFLRIWNETPEPKSVVFHPKHTLHEKIWGANAGVPGEIRTICSSENLSKKGFFLLARKRTYTPDFEIISNGEKTVYDVKGWNQTSTLRAKFNLSKKLMMEVYNIEVIEVRK